MTDSPTLPPMPTVIGPTTRFQVAFVGPLGVGKTTAVHSISDVKVISTEVMRATLAMKDVDHRGKTTTTVGIDYGEWEAPDGTRVGVLGTPGQVRFSSARASVVARRASIVLWVYGNHADAIDECREWLERIGDESVWERTIVAVTRRDADPRDVPSLEDYRRELTRYAGGLPVLEADPRVRADVVNVVATALNAAPAAGG